MDTSAPAFPSPTTGASLVLSFRLSRKTVLILGSNNLAASRAFSALEADAIVIVIAKGGLNSACEEIRWRAQTGQLAVLDVSSRDDELKTLERVLDDDPSVSIVCLTDTISGADPSQRRTRSSASSIYSLCHSRRIPVNITDMPEFCDFSFTSTHRFHHPHTGEPSPLQIGVTTNGQGCRLASRVRREIVSALPREVGAAVRKVGIMRVKAKEQVSTNGFPFDPVVEDDETNEDNGVLTPNRPVEQRSVKDLHEDILESARRRMKWVAQVSEYWPYARLAALSEDDMTSVLDGHLRTDITTGPGPNALPTSNSLHSLALSPSAGKIYLVGSGPGHPSLLTLATHTALTRHAQLVLSDKLVPAAVLELIPKDVEVRIARKFPGNAEGAQQEMMEAAIEAANRGVTVVRLKQGDPMVYGRAGEEILYFRARGFEPIVIPGVSSAIAGATFAGIPVTQRGAAENVIITTGVGRKGKDVRIPGYERGRTLVMLMGVARLAGVVEAMLAPEACYPPHIPIAIVERASMPDQRVVCSRLTDIVLAMESSGEQRPPGMIVVGWAVLALSSDGGKGDVGVLEEGAEEHDEERTRKWLGDKRWTVSEGIDTRWSEL